MVDGTARAACRLPGSDREWLKSSGAIAAMAAIAAIAAIAVIPIGSVSSGALPSLPQAQKRMAHTRNSRFTLLSCSFRSVIVYICLRCGAAEPGFNWCPQGRVGRIVGELAVIGWLAVVEALLVLQANDELPGPMGGEQLQRPHRFLEVNPCKLWA